MIRSGKSIVSAQTSAKMLRDACWRRDSHVGAAMTDWLYGLPEVLLIVLAAGLLATAVVFLPNYVQRVPFLKPTEPGFEFIIRMQAPLFTMAALVLTFTLVEAERNFRQIDANLKTEASQFDQLDRLLMRIDHPAAQACRPLLRGYVQSVLKDEWPTMLQRGDGSDKTRLAFLTLSSAILAIAPTPGRTAGDLRRNGEAAGRDLSCTRRPNRQRDRRPTPHLLDRGPVQRADIGVGQLRDSPHAIPHRRARLSALRDRRLHRFRVHHGRAVQG
jgi:hypothetical protein